jgi:DmsE family decaheme c-type cytochrome
MDDFAGEPHEIAGLSCTRCHRVHAGEGRLAIDRSAGLCLECHFGKRNQSMRESAHPVAEAGVTCLSCHRFTRRADAQLTYEIDGVCRRCHPEEAGPFLYPHLASEASLVEGRGCTACHDVHGAANPRLLARRGDGLCDQCHTPIGHEQAHGGIWADEPCAACHRDVHGSFVSNLFLDPAMEDRFSGDCFSAGCHRLNR